MRSRSLRQSTWQLLSLVSVRDVGLPNTRIAAASFGERLG